MNYEIKTEYQTGVSLSTSSSYTVTMTFSYNIGTIETFHIWDTGPVGSTAVLFIYDISFTDNILTIELRQTTANAVTYDFGIVAGIRGN